MISDREIHPVITRICIQAVWQEFIDSLCSPSVLERRYKELKDRAEAISRDYVVLPKSRMPWYGDMVTALARSLRETEDLLEATPRNNRKIAYYLGTVAARIASAANELEAM
jgi:hypothetical protein